MTTHELIASVDSHQLIQVQMAIYKMLEQIVVALEDRRDLRRLAYLLFGGIAILTFSNCAIFIALLLIAEKHL